MSIVKGYAFKCDEPSNWKLCSDEKWRTEVVKAAPRANFLGLRSIDGVRCSVWDARGVILAQVATIAKPPRTCG